MTDPKKTKHHDPKQDPESKSQKTGHNVQETAGADSTKPEGHEGDSRLCGNEKEGAGMKTEVGMKNKAVATEEMGINKEQELNKKIEELTGHLARSMADLQNYRRRSEEEKGRFVKFANAEMLKTLLPALENLDRSCKHLPEALKEDAWAKGILQTQAEISKALDRIGVKRIETVGKKMDLNLHEALMQGPGEKEMITEELGAGYTLNGETFKAAKVKVGDGSK